MNGQMLRVCILNITLKEVQIIDLINWLKFIFERSYTVVRCVKVFVGVMRKMYELKFQFLIFFPDDKHICNRFGFVKFFFHGLCKGELRKIRSAVSRFLYLREISGSSLKFRTVFLNKWESDVEWTVKI